MIPETIEYVNTKDQTVLFCGKPRRIRNTKMKDIEDLQEDIQKTMEKIQKNNTMLDDEINVLKNIMKKLDDIEEFRKIKKDIKKLEKQKIDDKELIKKSAKLATLLLEDITEKEYLEERNLTDSEMVFALPNVIKLILMRTDSKQINKFITTFIKNSVESQLTRLGSGENFQ